MSGAEHWERAKSWVVTAFFVAILPNAVEAGTDVDGWLWTTIRFTLSAVFVTALVYWLVALVVFRPRRHLR